MNSFILSIINDSRHVVQRSHVAVYTKNSQHKVNTASVFARLVLTLLVVLVECRTSNTYLSNSQFLSLAESNNSQEQATYGLNSKRKQARFT